MTAVQRMIRAVLMRGGTSKGLYFHANSLPADPRIRDQVLLAAYGSPDPNRRQIDGVGGAVSTTSKVAIISRATDGVHDVNYLFGQVAIDRPHVDYVGSCGNILAGVGPFAIDEGLVPAKEPQTSVSIYQQNTKKTIIAAVKVREGRHDPTGDYVLDGVPGTGSKITLRFLDPGGSVTGRLLPTGRVRDQVDVPGLGAVTVSVVDAANPVVFARAADLGLTGTEIEEIDASAVIKERLEAIRSRVAVMLGLARSPAAASAHSQAVPKMAVVAPPQEYRDVSGRTVRLGDITLVARVMSMGTLHRAFALTAGICAAGAARIDGTVVSEAAGGGGGDEVRIGHPGGVLAITPVVEASDGEFCYREARAGRSARRLMEGYVFVPAVHFQ